MTLRWLTAGESHGEALVGIIEGVPAGVELTTGQLRDALARRRLGYGRGARMKFEEDRVRILGGVRQVEIPRQPARDLNESSRDGRASGLTVWSGVPWLGE